MIKIIKVVILSTVAGFIGVSIAKVGFFMDNTVEELQESKKQLIKTQEEVRSLQIKTDVLQHELLRIQVSYKNFLEFYEQEHQKI